MNRRENNINLEQEKRWIEASIRSTKAFEPIYDKYYDEIFRFIYRRTSDTVLSEDLTSECFYKALKNIKRFKFNGTSIGAWLYTIARNETYKYYRSKKRHFIVEIDEFQEEINLEEEVNKFTTEDLVWVLEEIRDEELILVELKYFEHKTFKEVATLMHMKESAVKMRLYRLLLAMKQKIKQRHEQK